MKKLLIDGIKTLLAGVLIGIFISLFQFLTHEIIKLSTYLLTYDGNLIFILVILLSLSFSFVLIYINKKNPGYTGSGVPQFEGYQSGFYKINPYKMFIFIWINSLFGFFFCFLLGGEGPSISISSSIGLGINKKIKRDDKELIAACGSAGFGVAFMSPIAAFCHLLEENKKLLSVRLIIKGLFIIVISFIISHFIYNHNLLNISSDLVLPINYYYILVLIFIFSLFISKCYILLIVKIKDMTKRIKIWSYLLPIFILIFMVIKRNNSLLVGSGIEIISADSTDVSLLIIVGILVFRLIGTAISANQTISGGLVLPMIACGALVGDLIVTLISSWDEDVIKYKNLIVIISMLSVFSFVCHTPLTALALSLKLLCFKAILPLFIVLFFGTLVLYFFRQKNIYRELEERLPGFNEY